jgi:hypothetical protein
MPESLWASRFLLVISASYSKLMEFSRLSFRLCAISDGKLGFEPKDRFDFVVALSRTV